MMLKGLSFSALVFAVGFAAAPRVSAQSVPRTLVCKDGSMSSTSQGAWACLKHGGIDQQRSANAQRGVYGNTGVNATPANRGVYGNTGTTGNRGVYSPATNGSSRGVYNGGVVNGSDRGVYNGGVVNGSGRGVYDRVDNGNGKGKAKGHYKKHHHDKDNDGDADDRRGNAQRNAERHDDRQAHGKGGRYDDRR